jgi:cobalt-zinc-cadmium efflux system outer membrane protein
VTVRTLTLRTRGDDRSARPWGRRILLLALSVLPAPLAAQAPSWSDPALVGPLREALLGSNPALAAGRMEVAAAQARLSAAGLAPPVVFSGEIEDVPDGYDLPGAAVRVEIGREFLAGGRSAAARALARADVRAAEASLYAAQRGLDARLGRELVQAVANFAVARRLAAEDSLLIAAETGLRGRFAVGQARYVDVLRLRTERLRVQNERSEALAEAQAGRLALLALAGSAPADGYAAGVDSILAAGLARPTGGELPGAPGLDSLLALSGAVRQARAALDRAEAELAVVRAEQRPRFAASLGAQRMVGGGGGSTFGPVIGASITLPFTARRANRGALEAAEREAEAARARLEAVRAVVRGELAGALVRYEAARERLEVYDAVLLHGVRQERETALAAYRSGELSLVELLDFERALSRAEIERLRAEAIAAQAWADLISGAAGPDQPTWTERGEP